MSLLPSMTRSLAGQKNAWLRPSSFPLDSDEETTKMQCMHAVTEQKVFKNLTIRNKKK